jgi:transcriptional regulator of acetoin/glycerol metabolism
VRVQSSSAARFIEALPPEHPARWAIVASWNRCSHLSPGAEPPFHRVSEAELRDRLERNGALVEAAVPRLAWLVRQLPGHSNVAYVTDADGIVLASEGSAEQLRLFCLLPGYDWSEARMGTNGAGTCLAAGRPMVVAGREHFLTAFQNCTCTAAPIRGPAGRLMGALDVSSSVADARAHRIGVVTEAALEIEGALRRS